MRVRSSDILVLIILVSVGMSCSDRTTDSACYPESQELANPSDPEYWLDYPMCGIRWDRVEYPEAPDDQDGNWVMVSVCEALESGGQCDVCAADEIDAKILARAQERVDEAAMGAEPEGCDVAVAHVFRGCVATPDHQLASEAPQCCYRAWAWTACSVGSAAVD